MRDGFAPWAIGRRTRASFRTASQTLPTSPTNGLKFGLWIDWTQAGTSNETGALNVHDPAIRDWLIADPPVDWRHREPFKGVTIDIGLPAANAGPRANSNASSAIITSICSSTTAISWRKAVRAPITPLRRRIPQRCEPTRTRDSYGSGLQLDRCELSRDAGLLRNLPGAAATPACCSRSAMMAAAWWIRQRRPWRLFFHDGHL